MRTLSVPLSSGGEGAGEGQLIREEVMRAAGRKILFLPHAVRQMSRQGRMITPAEVRAILRSGEVIEDYPMTHEATVA